MPIANDEMRAVEAVLRALSTAAKTLRLYPPSSPLPLEAMQAAAEALGGILSVQPTLPLVVARQGFTFRGAPVNVTGATDLANMLTSHEVAQVDFLPGCTRDEVSAFLGVVMRDATEVRAEGGVAAALAMAGAGSIVVSEVVLATAVAEAAAGQDVDEFLRELAGDQQKLAAWLAAAASGDPGALDDGLAELARAVGPGGMAALEAALGGAFIGQEAGGRDTIVGLALGDGEAAPMLKGMLRGLRPHDLASSLSDGLYAKNMLSMSSVLTALPVGEKLDAIIEELRPMLAGEGHSDRELAFLGHMLEARGNTGRESALADRTSDYQAVAAMSRVEDAALATARAEVRSSAGSVNARTVNTMLSLLDQQQDFGLWSKTLTNLAALVPTLLSQGDVALADRVFGDLSSREALTKQPWPGVADHIHAAVERATSTEAMTALVTALLDDPSRAEHAKNILKHIGLPGQQRFLLAALGQRERDGLGAAEVLLGRRIVGLLGALASDVQWFQAGAVAARLSTEVDQHSREALAALARRPDERSRQEVAKGLGTSSSALALGVLSEMAKDSALEVAVTAVRSMGRTTALGAATALERVYDSLDALGKDFPLAREVLGALARTPDSGAVAILDRIAGQRALIKRGHFAEVQDLARQALASRAKGGVRS